VYILYILLLGLNVFPKLKSMFMVEVRKLIGDFSFEGCLNFILKIVHMFLDLFMLELFPVVLFCCFVLIGWLDMANCSINCCLGFSLRVFKVQQFCEYTHTVVCGCMCVCYNLPLGLDEFLSSLRLEN
jgi:hypothetical protein